MKIQLPEKVKFIIETIAAAGYEAYAVGGCIRDSILGREPNDWDVTTSATPEQVKALFRRTVDTGIQHGTVTVMLDKEGFEVTTYRIDGEYEDSRHPKEVIFTPNLVEDLKRRDFTINAMAYNDEAGLVDIFDGMGDINKGIIRCVGDPMERFTEDALRILRAIRFSAQLGYSIEENTKAAITRLAPNLRNISAERIQVELTKLLTSPHPDYMEVVYETGVSAIILPELDICMKTEQNHKHHCMGVGKHILCSLTYAPADKYLRWALLFHDIGKPQTLTVDEKGITHFYGHPRISAEMAREILKRLRFDNDTIHVVCRLVEHHHCGIGVVPDMRRVRRAINKMGEDIFPLFLQLWYADIMAQSEYNRDEKLEAIRLWKEMYEQIKENHQCTSLKTLAVTGSDLIALGMKPGKELGETLKGLLEYVLDHPEENTREKLLKRVNLPE